MIRDIELPGFLSRKDLDDLIQHPNWFLWTLLTFDIFQKRILKQEAVAEFSKIVTAYKEIPDELLKKIRGNEITIQTNDNIKPDLQIDSEGVIEPLITNEKSKNVSSIGIKNGLKYKAPEKKVDLKKYKAKEKLSRFLFNKNIKIRI